MLIDYILKLSIKLFSNLVFHPENIERNLNMTNGLIMAERFMAELTRKGVGKQTAYALVRKCSLEAYAEDAGLKEIVLSNNEIRKYLTKDEIEKIMDPHTYLQSSGQIIENVLKDSKRWF